MNCHICESERLTSINTYKHIWFSCDDCGNILRQPKEKCFLDFLPDGLFQSLPRGNVIVSFCKKKKNGEEMYDHYLNTNREQSLSSQGTDWENELLPLQQELAKLNISLVNKSVLDLSGGPGFLAQALENICQRVVVTEYSQGSVDRIKQHLKVNAVTFDYNSEDIHEVVPEKFDIVLIRYSINFCLDIGKLLISLRKILNDDGIVYVSFVVPTLGTCLRWQCDDYTYHILYHPETMARLFAEKNFTLLSRYEGGASYHYLTGRLFKFLSPLLLSYRLLNGFKKCNQELHAKNKVMIFRKS